MTQPVRTGEDVYDVTDPRHIGRLDAVLLTGCTITWRDTGWESRDVPQANLRRAFGSKEHGL